MVGTRWAFAAGKRGIVKFSGAAMTGLGLRAGPYGTVTSLPAAFPGGLSGKGALSQIASGGGWDTAIWVTNSSRIASSGGLVTWANSCRK